MTRRTFDGGPGIWSETEPEVQHRGRVPEAPLMTFTLIDGGEDADEATVASEVRAAFASSRSSSASSDTVGAAPQGGSSSLRRILGTADFVDAQSAMPSVAPQEQAVEEFAASDESGSLLRPNPTFDRLENQYTVVLPVTHGPAPTSRWSRRRTR